MGFSLHIVDTWPTKLMPEITGRTACTARYLVVEFNRTSDHGLLASTVADCKASTVLCVADCLIFISLTKYKYYF